MIAGVFGEIAANAYDIVLAASGDDYELDRIAAALRKLTPEIGKTDPPGLLSCPLTWAAVCQLGHTFNGGSLGQWMPGPRLREWTLAELLKRTAVPSAEDLGPANAEQPAAEARETATFRQPAAMVIQLANARQPAAAISYKTAIDGRNAADDLRAAKVGQLVPRPYQAEGAAMIGAGGKFLLFDDPGVGKTVTTLLGLLAREARGEAVFPMVIIVPSWDVGDVWARHVRDWAPGWPEAQYYKGPDRASLLPRRSRGRTAADSHVPQVLITTYATARLDAADARGPLARLGAASVVCDEVHAIKNEDSQQSRAVRRIAAGAGTFVGLSGTPVTRDTGDIYPILAAMDPRSWPNRKRMVHRYCMTEEDDYGETIQGLLPLAEPEFFAVLTGQYRRASKADVLPQLPPKVYSVRRIELPPEWRRAYDGMAAEMLAELPEGGELEVMSVLAQLTRLSQLASSAADVTITLELDEATGEERKKYGVKLRGPSWKADAMLEVLAERPHQQAAVFTVSRQLADIAGAALLAQGYRCAFITGGQSRRERQEGIDAFQAGERDVIVATAGAGSLGITLTAAGTVIMLQRSWELDKAMQPEDRAHRIGQRHDCVEVIDVVAKGTVDERVRELLRVKGGHLGSLVRDARIARELLGGLK